MRLVTLLILSAAVLAACETPPALPSGDAEALTAIARARTAHGAAVLDNADVSFTFRGTPFVVSRNGATFRYQRTTTDSTGATIVEWVDNDGTHRSVNGTEVTLAADEAGILATAVNSVAYFALLPYSLGDPAVRARSLAPDTINGQAYDRVEVTFAQDAGGADWEDRYVYWIHPGSGTMDYLAYSYEPDAADTSRSETGTRFREVIGVQTVGGVRFQDYRNLTADSIGSEIERFGDFFNRGETFQVSDVILENIAVTPR